MPSSRCPLFACLAVAMRARAWRMDPFAVATKTYSVNDILAYESQLVTAVINRHSPIKGRLVPRYVGTGADRQCILEPETLDGQVLPYESPKVKDIGVKNSPLWKNDPDQQLFYSSARAWARRYFPELLLGVYDPEEARTMRDVTPRDEQRVDNYLEHEGPAAPEAETIDTETGEILEGAEPVTIEPAEPEPVPPEIIIRNMVKAVEGFTSEAHLNEWLEESKADLAALHKDLRRLVEKAIAAKRVELEEL